jgi:high-affinity iron transporter
MMQVFLVAFRESLEAALLLAVILAYLDRRGYRKGFRAVWIGVAAAIALSILAGSLLFFLVGEFASPAEQLFEGFTLLLGLAVLSFMIVWMKGEASDLTGRLQRRVEAALHRGSGWSVGLLAFLVIVREGLELALFLFAAASTATPLVSVIGGLGGLGLAVVLGALVYAGGRRLNLRLLFQVTGILLIFFGAGLFSRAIAEFQEIGLITFWSALAWNIEPFLNMDSLAGKLLGGLFGYHSHPSWLMVAAYLSYLVVFLGVFLSPSPKQQKVQKRPLSRFPPKS